jgi:hypothetical protein
VPGVLNFNWLEKRPHNELDLKNRENILQPQRQLDNNSAIMTSAKKHVPIVKKRESSNPQLRSLTTVSPTIWANMEESRNQEVC